MIAVSAQSNERLLLWARRQCEAFKVIDDDFRALGIERDGTLGAAVFYDHWRLGDCNMSVLIQDRRAATRGALRAAFRYPFDQVGLRRVSATANSFNGASISLIERRVLNKRACAVGLMPTGPVRSCLACCAANVLGSRHANGWKTPHRRSVLNEDSKGTRAARSG
jgi:hypothetical protein